MHNLEVVLVVAAVDLAKRSHKVLVDQGHLPYAILENCSSLRTASDLLDRYTGFEARVNDVGWVDLIACPLVDNANRMRDNERWIAVPYVCLIPEATDLLAGQWIDILELKELFMDHFSILVNSIRNIR